MMSSPEGDDLERDQNPESEGVRHPQDIPEQTGHETVTETQAEEVQVDRPEEEDPDYAEQHLNEVPEESKEYSEELKENRCVFDQQTSDVIEESEEYSQNFTEESDIPKPEIEIAKVTQEQEIDNIMNEKGEPLDESFGRVEQSAMQQSKFETDNLTKYAKMVSEVWPEKFELRFNEFKQRLIQKYKKIRLLYLAEFETRLRDLEETKRGEINFKTIQLEEKEKKAHFNESRDTTATVALEKAMQLQRERCKKRLCF